MTRILPVGLESAAALGAVHTEAFDRPWTPKDIAELVASPGVAAIAAGEPDRFEGFVLVRSVAGEAEILTLAVRPTARRQGIGRALVEAAAAAAAAGSDILWLEVAADNEAALALYAGAGFAPSGRRAAYYARRSGPPVDALVLRRVLNTVAR